MGRPLQVRQETRDSCARAVRLGEAGSIAGVPELLTLSRHSQAIVRRAAASALGKLAAFGDVGPAVPRLRDLTRDPHPQVRQYAILALGKTGDEGSPTLLEDAMSRPTETEYNRVSAARASEQIRKLAEAKRVGASGLCSRCGGRVSAAERDMSMRQFQRAYCDACFNRVFIERRNFDMKVQNAKTIVARGETVVQSRGERLISEWLASHGVAFRYDDKFQIISGYAIRPDFYLPEFDVYIEFWGLDTTDYKIGMLLKQKLYQQEGRRLISVYPKDLLRLDDHLAGALSAHGWVGYVREP